MKIKNILISIVILFNLNLNSQNFRNMQNALDYNIPLNLPVGINGVKPKLILNYNSNRGDGFYGLNWNSNINSSIEKCKSNFNFNNNQIDEFGYDNNMQNMCLDGERLIQISNDQWSTETIYRTNTNQYSKIVYDGLNFKVYTKTGDIKEYQKYNQTWLLSTTTNRFNNLITYNYNTNLYETYLDTIVYDNNEVKFIYENRKDQRNFSKRVKAIDVRTNNRLLKTYKFMYNYQTSSMDQSTINSITECTNGICFELFEKNANLNSNQYNSQINNGFSQNPYNKYSKDYEKLLRDMNNDGITDIVEFTNNGVFISYNNGNNTFRTPIKVVNSFGRNIDGWDSKENPRMLKDMNSDGLIDIVGFGSKGVMVAFSNGNGTFRIPVKVVNSFGRNAGGWKANKHPRMVADMNSNGANDIVGFGDSGVVVSYNNGNGTFKTPAKVINAFGKQNGWKVSKHPRMLADMNGDGTIDIVGFSSKGVMISFNNGNGTFRTPIKVVNSFGTEAGGWKVDKHPRMLADINGDGAIDIVGFGESTIVVSFNNGNGTFKSPTKILNEFTNNY